MIDALRDFYKEDKGVKDGEIDVNFDDVLDGEIFRLLGDNSEPRKSIGKPNLKKPLLLKKNTAEIS